MRRGDCDVLFWRMICSVSKLGVETVKQTRHHVYSLPDFWAERRMRRRSRGMLLDAFLASSRSLHSQATNHTRHAVKLACPPFLRYSLVSASHVTATHPTCSFAAASAEPAPPNSRRTLTTSQSESRRRCVLAKRMCDCLEPSDVKPTSRHGPGASRSAACGGKALHIESKHDQKFSDGACSTCDSSLAPSIMPRSTPLAVPYFMFACVQGSCFSSGGKPALIGVVL